MSTASIKDLRIERPVSRNSGGGMWGAVLLLLIVCGGGAAGAWYYLKVKPVIVRTAVVGETTMNSATAERTVLNASGYVTARREATVSSKVTGKVQEVFIEEGMRVKEGQVLAKLDNANVRTSMALSEAQLTSSLSGLEETRVRIKEAERELRRESGLVSKKVTTESDYDRAEASAMALKAKLQQQQAEVTVAMRSVESWQQQMEDTIIRAPFAGIVTSKNAQPGEMISPMSAGGGFTRTGICTIVDMESLEIEIDVNESYINRVVPGQPVEAALDAYPDWKIPCKVIAIIPTADRQKSTVRVRVAFEKLDLRILPDMAVKVSFRETPAPEGAKKKNAPGTVVPASALTDDQGKDILYVVQSGKAERRAVTVANKSAEQALLTAGVAAGEKVILSPPKELVDGVRVKEVR